MPQLRLTVGGPGATADVAEIERLKADIDEHVGPASFLPSAAEEGAKGPFGLDIATLVVSLLGTPAVVALVGVLKGYLESSRVSEVEITGPGGSAKLKLPRGSQLSAEQIRRVLDSVLGPEPG